MSDRTTRGEPSAGIIDIIRDHAHHRPDAPALTYSEGPGADRSFSYAELWAHVENTARNLGDEGWRGERVALLFAPGYEFVIAFLATLAVGGVAVPIAPIGRRRERLANLARVLADCSPIALMSDEASSRRYGPGLTETATLGIARFIEFGRLQNREEEWRPVESEPDDLAVLQYTSGSTSWPKGVMITHDNIMASERMIRSAFGHDHESTFVGWAPHFHDQGLFGNIMQPLFLGSHLIMTSPTAFLRRPLLWLELISRFRAITSGGPNFAYELCVDAVEKRGMPDIDLSSWKAAFNGAEQVNVETMRRFADTFAPLGFDPQAFLPCYGLAECTLLASGHHSADPFVTRSAGDGRPVVACGPPTGDTEVLIVDCGGRCVPERTIGHIYIAGPHVGSGYWCKPDVSQETFGVPVRGRNGSYLKTGDLGFFDDGLLFITGRKNDMIIVRGRNVPPHDIESLWRDALPHRTGEVAAVQGPANEGGRVWLVAECGKGERHEDKEELVKCLHADAAIFRKMSIERLGLAIDDVFFVKANSIPKTTSGKIQRSKIRRSLIERTAAIIVEG